MLYQNAYVWLVFLSALDVMLTWITLAWGGREANLLARPIIEHVGLGGIVIFKFALIVLVIVVCESIGRHSARAGRRFVTAAILVACVPVAVAFAQLVVDVMQRLV